MSVSGYGPGDHNGIILPKIPPKDAEISASFLRTNGFAKEQSGMKGEGAEKNYLSQALAVRGEL